MKPGKKARSRIYFRPATAEQDARLLALSEKTGRSLNYLVTLALDEFLATVEIIEARRAAAQNFPGHGRSA